MCSLRYANCMRWGDNMARIYASLINKGMKTLSDVPEALRADVKNILKEEGGE